MKSWKKVAIILLLFVQGITIINVWKAQAPSYKKYSIEQNEVNRDDVGRLWIETYLDSHLNSMNLKDPLQSYKIEVLDIIKEEPVNHYNYHVAIKGESKELPSTLFKTIPSYNEGNYNVDILLTLEFTEGKIKHFKDVPY